MNIFTCCSKRDISGDSPCSVLGCRDWTWPRPHRICGILLTSYSFPKVHHDVPVAVVPGGAMGLPRSKAHPAEVRLKK